MAEAPDINVDELRRRARRRLIGAIVLALGAAVIVPMLLESDPKPLGEDVAVRIPAEDNAKFVNRLSDKGAKSTPADANTKSDAVKVPAKSESAATPAPPESPSSTTNVPAPKRSIAQAEQKVLGGPTKPATTAAPAPAPTAAAPVAAAPAISAPATAPASSGNVAPSAQAEPTNDATKASPREGFSVQLAAFADDKGANSLANKLKRAAYPAYTEPLNTSKGTLWRVRVGPYPSRDAAVEVRDKLKGEGYSGIVAAAQ